MGKKKQEETVIQQEKEVKKEVPKVLSLADLKKLLKEKEELKIVLENEYFKLQGQIQFLYQQIQTLEGR